VPSSGLRPVTVVCATNKVPHNVAYAALIY